MQDLLTQFNQQNSSLIHSNKRIVIAFSGGLDSCVLLNLLLNSLDKSRLLLVHVNHQLQQSAGSMQQFCKSLASSHAIKYQTHNLDLTNVLSNIEEKARQARYLSISNPLNTDSDIILTAHHSDDQLETLMLNLARSSGVAGLRGIAKKLKIHGIECQRPLLGFSRDQIFKYATENNLNWIEDESNQDDRFDRNFIRLKLTPLLKQRWPKIENSFSTVASHQQESYECLKELATIDLNRLLESVNYSATKVLKINELSKLSNPRIKNVVKFWLIDQAESLSYQQLNRLLNLVVEHSDSNKKVELKNGFINSYNGKLFYCNYSNQPVKILKIDLNKDQILISNLNAKQLSYSSHFMKRQFQAFKIPPWVRSEIKFLVDKPNPKQVKSVFWNNAKVFDESSDNNN